MVIVAGYLVVDPLQRESYLLGCKAVVQQARRTQGCLDFAISADLLDPSRIDVFERWNRRPPSMGSGVAGPRMNNNVRSCPRRFPNTTWKLSGG